MRLVAALLLAAGPLGSAIPHGVLWLIYLAATMIVVGGTGGISLLLHRHDCAGCFGTVEMAGAVL